MGDANKYLCDACEAAAAKLAAASYHTDVVGKGSAFMRVDSREVQILTLALNQYRQQLSGKEAGTDGN